MLELYFLKDIADIIFKYALTHCSVCYVRKIDVQLAINNTICERCQSCNLCEEHSFTCRCCKWQCCFVCMNHCFKCDDYICETCFKKTYKIGDENTMKCTFCKDSWLMFLDGGWTNIKKSNIIKEKLLRIKCDE